MAVGTWRAGRAIGGTITFDWTPEPEVIAKELFRTADALEDRSVPLAMSREVARADVRERFETNTTPDGGAWADWARDYPDSTFALKRTYALMGAATSPSAYPVTHDSVFLRTGGFPEYWIYHQEGADRGGGGITDREQWIADVKAMGMEVDEELLAAVSEGGGGNLPARPFLPISDEAQYAILEVFESWFDTVVSSFGGVRASFTKTGQLRWRGPGGRFAKSPFG